MKPVTGMCVVVASSCTCRTWTHRHEPGQLTENTGALVLKRTILPVSCFTRRIGSISSESFLRSVCWSPRLLSVRSLPRYRGFGATWVHRDRIEHDLGVKRLWATSGRKSATSAMSSSLRSIG